jgi:hypothetical protein
MEEEVGGYESRVVAFTEPATRNPQPLIRIRYSFFLRR